MSFTITVELLLVKNIVFFIQKKKSITHSNTIDRLFSAQRPAYDKSYAKKIGVEKTK